MMICYIVFCISMWNIIANGKSCVQYVSVNQLATSIRTPVTHSVRLDLSLPPSPAAPTPYPLVTK